VRHLRLPVNGALTVVSNVRRGQIELPGLVVVPRPGPGALWDDHHWAEGLRLASDARTLVDNLALSRGRVRAARTLSRADLEDWLVRRSQRRPDDWLPSLRERAVELCGELGVEERRGLVDQIVGTAAGTRAVRTRTGHLRAARAAGREYDPDRVRRFDDLATFLQRIPAELDVPDALAAPDDETSTSLPFYEAYFSNFIEGTEFTVEEAEEIVASGDVPDERPADGHDILGTYAALADPALRGETASTFDAFLELLERRHRVVMEGRPDKRPGRFKERRNQAGSYVFVAPDLVEGTLAEGFRRLGDLPEGF
jgi:hypothetical protein